jgi:hypothetical protein
MALTGLLPFTNKRVAGAIFQLPLVIFKGRQDQVLCAEENWSHTSVMQGKILYFLMTIIRNEFTPCTAITERKMVKYYF